jgi:hypothetical protein
MFKIISTLLLLLLTTSTILAQAPQITQPPVGQTVTAGQNAQFTVTATGSNLLYQWLKGGMSLGDGGRIVGSAAPTLVINGAQETDEGSYSVVVTVSGSPELKASSEGAPLKVNPVSPPAPNITQQPTAQTVTVGQNAQFTVTATGANLVYRWAKDGIDLVDGGRISGASTATLTITAAVGMDIGSYSVGITIAGFPDVKAGSDGALLKVEPLAPQITQQPHGQLIIHGQDAEFSVVATGTSLIYQWAKDGVSIIDNGNISGASTSRLLIARVEASDEGSYSVVVSVLDSPDLKAGSDGAELRVIPPAGTLSLSAATFAVTEGTASLTIPVNRTGDSVGEVTVAYTLDGITAINADFTGAGGNLNFADGITTQNVVIPIVDDVSFEGPETLMVSLSAPTGGATLGAITSATITINDNDVFSPRAAGYTGLLNGDFVDNGYGSISFQRTAKGTLTGKLLVDGRAFSFSGKLSPTGYFTKTFSYKVGTESVKPMLTLQIQRDGTFIGAWDAGKGTIYEIGGEENATGTSTVPNSRMGKYSAHLRGLNLTPAGGPVSGYLRATVGANGATTFVGALPDGTILSGASRISINGNLPVVFGLYQAKTGYLFGPAAITGNASARVFAGDLVWFKPPQTRGVYKAGLSRANIELAGHVWTKPLSGSRLVPDFDDTGGNMLVTLSEGDLAADIPKVVKLTTANTVVTTPRTSESLLLTVTPDTGFFTGSFRQPNGTTRTFNGVFVQADAGASTIEGYFPGASVPGRVTITVPAQ